MDAYLTSKTKGSTASVDLPTEALASYLTAHMDEQRLELQRAWTYATSVEAHDTEYADNPDPDYAPNVSDGENAKSGEGIMRVSKNSLLL